MKAFSTIDPATLPSDEYMMGETDEYSTAAAVAARSQRGPTQGSAQ